MKTLTRKTPGRRIERDEDLDEKEAVKPPPLPRQTAVKATPPKEKETAVKAQALARGTGRQVSRMRSVWPKAEDSRHGGGQEGEVSRLRLRFCRMRVCVSFFGGMSNQRPRSKAQRADL